MVPPDTELFNTFRWATRAQNIFLLYLYLSDITQRIFPAKVVGIVVIMCLNASPLSFTKVLGPVVRKPINLIQD